MKIKIFQWDNVASASKEEESVKKGQRDSWLPGCLAEERINDFLSSGVEIVSTHQSSCTWKNLQGFTSMGTCLTIFYE